MRKGGSDVSENSYQVQEHVKLLAVKNPWGLGGVELTCFTLAQAMGMGEAEIAQKLFGIRDSQAVELVRKSIEEVTKAVGQSHERKVSGYGATVEQINTLINTPNLDARRISYLKQRLEAALRQKGLIALPKKLETSSTKPKAFEQSKPVESDPAETESLGVDHFQLSPNYAWGPVAPLSCARCRGTMIPDPGSYGNYTVCINCGFEFEIRSSAPPSFKLIWEESQEFGQKRRQPSHGKLRL